MISRGLALAFGLAGATLLSQFPEFAQQYLQRLAGAVSELERQVVETAAAATALDMSRAAYLADLSASRAGQAAAQKAEAEIRRFDRLNTALERFREASALGRLVTFPVHADRALIAGTLADFRPAIPVTRDGAVFAGLGFLAGWGSFRLASRAGRRKGQRRRNGHYETAQPARTTPETTTDEDAPFLEWEGDASVAILRPLPSIALPAHDGSVVDLSMLTAPAVIFLFPLIARPGAPLPQDWAEVENAESGTAMACSFRDAYDIVRKAGMGEVFGVSGQSAADLKDAAHRLALPFPLLSDPRLEFAFALDLPRFLLHHERYLAPTALVVQHGHVIAALHPIYEPARAATHLINRLADAQARQLERVQSA